MFGSCISRQLRGDSPVFHRLHRRGFRRNGSVQQPILSGKGENGNGKRRLEMLARWRRKEKQISPLSVPERAVKILAHFSQFGPQSNVHGRRENFSRTDLDRFPVERGAWASAR